MTEAKHPDEASFPLVDRRHEALARYLAKGLSVAAAGRQIGYSKQCAGNWSRREDVKARAKWLSENASYVPSSDEVLTKAWNVALAAAASGNYKASLDGLKWIHEIVRTRMPDEEKEGVFSDQDLESLASGAGDILAA